MESFSTIDIFDTKGNEYIFVIIYLLLLILFWRFSSRTVRISSQIKKSLGVLSANVLRIPQGLFFSKNHTWTHLEPSGIANVGLNDLLKQLTGELTLRFLKSPGDEITKGELLTEIIHRGKTLRIFSPISGIIQNTNTLLNDHQEILNEDPYGNGWVYKIKPSNWVAETNTYYMAEEATRWVTKELVRFKDFLAVSLEKHSPQTSMIALQDGGELIENPLSDLPEEVWMDFQNNFLNNNEEEGIICMDVTGFS